MRGGGGWGQIFSSCFLATRVVEGMLSHHSRPFLLSRFFAVVTLRRGEWKRTPLAACLAVMPWSNTTTRALFLDGLIEGYLSVQSERGRRVTPQTPPYERETWLLACACRSLPPPPLPSPRRAHTPSYPPRTLTHPLPPSPRYAEWRHSPDVGGLQWPCISRVCAHRCLGRQC